MHLGIADHLGWAVAVTATPDGDVVDRRRIELVDPGLPAAPIHHEGGAHPMHRTGEPLDDGGLAALVAKVRASVVRVAASALDGVAASVADPIESMSLRHWPSDFPEDIVTLRRVPYEARADAVMYRQVLAELGARRGWAIHLYDAKTVEGQAEQVRGAGVLAGPRAALGPPWSKDHRAAFAATILAAMSK